MLHRNLIEIVARAERSLADLPVARRGKNVKGSTLKVLPQLLQRDLHATKVLIEPQGMSFMAGMVVRRCAESLVLGLEVCVVGQQFAKCVIERDHRSGTFLCRTHGAVDRYRRLTARMPDAPFNRLRDGVVKGNVTGNGVGKSQRMHLTAWLQRWMTRFDGSAADEGGLQNRTDELVYRQRFPSVV